MYLQVCWLLATKGSWENESVALKQPLKCVTLWCKPMCLLINKRLKDSISQIYWFCLPLFFSHSRSCTRRTNVLRIPSLHCCYVLLLSADYLSAHSSIKINHACSRRSQEEKKKNAAPKRHQGFFFSLHFEINSIQHIMRLFYGHFLFYHVGSDQIHREAKFHLKCFNLQSTKSISIYPSLLNYHVFIWSENVNYLAGKMMCCDTMMRLAFN